MLSGLELSPAAGGLTSPQWTCCLWLMSLYLSTLAMLPALLTAWRPWPRSSMTTLASWRVLW